MKFRTELKPQKFDFEINYNSKVLFIGSCFSQNIGNKLSINKFNTFINPHGTIFNPVSIFNALGDIINEKKYTPDDLYKHNNQFLSLNHNTSFNNENPEITLKKINTNIQHGFEYIKDGDILFITFGTSWAYKSIETNQFVANCHKIPQAYFEKELLDALKLVQAYRELIKKINYLNKDIKIVLTVSPVRHIKDGIIHNSLSKSQLITLCHALSNEFKNTTYFPAYEILMDDLRDYRFYENDLVHPNGMAIEYVFNFFKDSFFSPETKTEYNQISKIIKSLNHKPQNTSSEEHKAFVKRQIANLNIIKMKFPFINFQNEEDLLATLI